MENPYLILHQEFSRAGADVLLSSGQACVVFGIAAFSKDGDWIVRENRRRMPGGSGAHCGAAAALHMLRPGVRHAVHGGL